MKTTLFFDFKMWYYYDRDSPAPIKWIDEDTEQSVNNNIEELNDSTAEYINSFKRYCEQLSDLSGRLNVVDKPAKDFYNIFMPLITDMQEILEKI